MGASAIPVGLDLTNPRSAIMRAASLLSGPGGVVKQLTNRATAVTLNAPCGIIISDTTALGPGLQAQFTFNNSLLRANDILLLALNGNTQTTLNQTVYTVPGLDNGSAQIVCRNNSGGSNETGANEVAFAIIRIIGLA